MISNGEYLLAKETIATYEKEQLDLFNVTTSTKPDRDYFEDVEKWEDSFYCNECGEDENFAYDRTVSNGEVWHCKNCKTGTVVGHKPNEDNY